MTYKDKEIVCSACKEKFIFGVGEQEYYKSVRVDRFTGEEMPNGLPEPRRCPDCRATRKRLQNKMYQ
jgi:hypothetical protein